VETYKSGKRLQLELERRGKKLEKHHSRWPGNWYVMRVMQKDRHRSAKDVALLCYKQVARLNKYQVNDSYAVI